jgi:hypothetical protein
LWELGLTTTIQKYQFLSIWGVFTRECGVADTPVPRPWLQHFRRRVELEETNDLLTCLTQPSDCRRSPCSNE